MINAVLDINQFSAAEKSELTFAHIKALFILPSPKLSFDVIQNHQLPRTDNPQAVRGVLELMTRAAASLASQSRDSAAFHNALYCLEYAASL